MKVNVSDIEKNFIACFLYNKSGTAITVYDTDLNYVIYNFTIYKRKRYEIKLGKRS